MRLLIVCVYLETWLGRRCVLLLGCRCEGAGGGLGGLVGGGTWFCRFGEEVGEEVGEEMRLRDGFERVSSVPPLSCSPRKWLFLHLWGGGRLRHILLLDCSS